MFPCVVKIWFYIFENYLNVRHAIFDIYLQRKLNKNFLLIMNNFEIFNNFIN